MEKTNSNISKCRALVFLRYCLERYDCFSIYKIESGPFKFLKFCMQNTAIAYVGGHSHQLLYTVEYTMLHGRKQQLSWRLKGKTKEVHTDLNSVTWEKETNGIKGHLLAAATHRPTSLCFTPHWVWKVSRVQEGYSGAPRSWVWTPSLQIPVWSCKGESVSILRV